MHSKPHTQLLHTHTHIQWMRRTVLVQWLVNNYSYWCFYLAGYSTGEDLHSANSGERCGRQVNASLNVVSAGLNPNNLR